MTYHFYFFVGKFPKLFNFSDSKEKSYLVELNTFKENVFYGLKRKFYCIIFPEKFIIVPQDYYIWSAIVNGTCTQKIKIGHQAKFWTKTNVFGRYYFRFEWCYATFNFQCAYFDSLSWCVHLDYGICRLCSKKPFWASLRVSTPLHIDLVDNQNITCLQYSTIFLLLKRWRKQKHLIKMFQNQADDYNMKASGV